MASLDTRQAKVRAGLLAAAAAYLVGAALWMWPVTLHPASSVFNPGDPLHLGWVMAWDAHQIVRTPWHLFDSNSFFPYARSLTFGDHLLPEALMVAPLFWLTGNAVLGFNVAVWLGLALSALAMFLLVRELTGSGGAAFVAGAAYAFNGFTQHELPRVQVVHLEWWPLALLFLVRFVRAGRTRDAGLFVAALALQGLSGTYYLVYSALLAPFWLVLAWRAARRRPSGRDVGLLAGWGLLAGLPVVLVLWPYLLTYRAIGFAKEWADGVDLLGPLDVRWSWLLGHWVGPAPQTTPLFLGLCGVVLLLLGARWAIMHRGDEGARMTLALALVPLGVGLVLSWGTTIRIAGWALGPGPAELLYRYVPPLRGMAGSERAGVLLRLGAAIVGGYALARVLQRMRPTLKPAAVAAAAVVLIFEQWSWPSSATTVPTGSQVPAVYRFLAETPGEPIVELPPHRGTQQKLWSTYLYFSTYHWRPLPIGRTSFYPPAHNWLIWTLRGFPDDRSLDLLERLGIRTVVVHPMAWHVSERKARVAAVDASPRLELVRHFEEPLPKSFVDVLRLGDERVYRVLPGRNAAPPPLCAPSEEAGGGRWRLRAEEPTSVDSLRDGDPRTGWLVQEEGRRTLEVRLAEPQSVAAIALDVAYPWTALPPGAVLDVKPGPGAAWESVVYDDGIDARWDVIHAQLTTPHAVRWTLRFAPRTVGSLRLTAGSVGTEGPFGPWSLGELRLYRRCDPPAASDLSSRR